MYHLLRSHIRISCIAFLICTCYLSTLVLQTIHHSVRVLLVLITGSRFLHRWQWQCRWAQLGIIRFYSKCFCFVMNIHLGLYEFCDHSASPHSSPPPLLKPSTPQDVDRVSILSFTDSLTKKIMYQSNHISFVDVLLIGSIFRTSFLAKSDVLSWPVLGRMIHWVGIQFLQRASVQARYDSLFTLKKNLSYTPFCIFPEGTTTDRWLPDLTKWHSGNMWTLQKCQEYGVMTLSICYEHTKDNAWVGDRSFLNLLYDVAKRSHTQVHIVWSYIPHSTLAPLTLREQSLKVFSRITAQCIEGHCLHKTQQSASTSDHSLSHTPS